MEEAFYEALEDFQIFFRWERHHCSAGTARRRDIVSTVFVMGTGPTGMAGHL